MLAIPQEGIELEYPLGEPVTCKTALFRPDTDIAAAMDLVREFGQDERQIVSLGCSIGSELDSIRASSVAQGLQGSETYIGVDRSQKAIELAQRGQYMTRPVAIDPWEEGKIADLEDKENRLERAGFQVLDREVASKRIEDNNGKNRLIPHHSIIFSSKKLREGADYKFISDDIENLQPRALGKGATMVVISNVLYHLKPDKASEVLDFASTLLGSSGAVLVVGESRRFNSVDDPKADIFNTWLEGEVLKLRQEYGLEPKKFDGAGNPTIFATN